eukprot:3331557-Prymnesium_polylepis.1
MLVPNSQLTIYAIRIPQRSHVTEQSSDAASCVPSQLLGKDSFLAGGRSTFAFPFVIPRFTNTTSPQHGGLGRCPQEPGIYSKCLKTTNDSDDGSYVTVPLYVDGLKLYYDADQRARAEAERLQTIYGEKFGVTFGEEDPDEDYFLEASRVNKEMCRNKHDRKVVSITATTYIDLMVKRFANGDISPCEEFP